MLPRLLMRLGMFFLFLCCLLACQVEDMLAQVGRSRGALGGEEAVFALRQAAQSASDVADKAKGEYDVAQKVFKK